MLGLKTRARAVKICGIFFFFLIPQLSMYLCVFNFKRNGMKEVRNIKNNKNSC